MRSPNILALKCDPGAFRACHCLKSDEWRANKNLQPKKPSRKPQTSEKRSLRYNCHTGLKAGATNATAGGVKPPL
jgi:hypothetical protein